eukprot:GHVU01077697.1.p1 GENE.GHVU01077697.1~~GHVU01077697.1.p1  ORF type:complete len:441 (+),score=132.09 GHVU01077697.1:510-1832(+)
MGQDFHQILDARGALFSNCLIYRGGVDEAANDALKDVGGCSSSEGRRQMSVGYQLFTACSQVGVNTPLDFCWHSEMGIYVRTKRCIRKNTLICEYAGCVEPLRRNLSFLQVKGFDSIYELLTTSESKDALVVVPEPYMNVGRFIAGVNNASVEGRKQQNVSGNRVPIEGHMRIILSAATNIPAGTTLFLDYNGFRAHFPTGSFAVDPFIASTRRKRQRKKTTTTTEEAAAAAAAANTAAAVSGTSSSAAAAAAAGGAGQTQIEVERGRRGVRDEEAGSSCSGRNRRGRTSNTWQRAKHGQMAGIDEEEKEEEEEGKEEEEEENEKEEEDDVVAAGSDNEGEGEAEDQQEEREKEMVDGKEEDDGGDEHDSFLDSLKNEEESEGEEEEEAEVVVRGKRSAHDRKSVKGEASAALNEWELEFDSLSEESTVPWRRRMYGASC